MTDTEPTNTKEHPMAATDPTSPDQYTDAPDPAPAGGHQMDSRMMWVMMIGCCLAIPLALIIGGASLGGLTGASPWLVGVGAVLAIALVITHRISAGPRCDTSSDGHG